MPRRIDERRELRIRHRVSIDRERVDRHPSRRALAVARILGAGIAPHRELTAVETHQRVGVRSIGHRSSTAAAGAAEQLSERRVSRR